MKFGQLIEYDMRNIFLENSYIECGEDTSSIPFSEKYKMDISLDQWSKFFWVFLYAELTS